MISRKIMKAFQCLFVIMGIQFLACNYTEVVKPNIILLLVDDLGWADLGYRNPTFITPNIDQLKADGMDFTRAYISTPTCSPSRASILTGKEAVKLQMVRHIPEDMSTEYSLWPKDPAKLQTRNWLPLEEVTYAEKLKQEGYYNYFVGKWHLGPKANFPIMQGFDEQFGTTQEGHPRNYYAPYFKIEDPFENINEKKYLTDILTDEAVRIIEGHDKEDPFSLTLWYYSVHGPYEGKNEWMDIYEKKGLIGKELHFASMVSAVDESIGRIRAALNKSGIDSNTVIIFMSDQGGAFSNSPLRGGKYGGQTLCEGGARVPFIVCYPGKIDKGGCINTPVQNIDILPTLVELSSGKSIEDPGIDGVSLMPLFKGKNIKPRNLFFFRSYEDQYCSILQDSLKLIKYHSGIYELFNLKNDVKELHDLSNVDSVKFERMKRELNDWEKEVRVGFINQ